MFDNERLAGEAQVERLPGDAVSLKSRAAILCCLAFILAVGGAGCSTDGTPEDVPPSINWLLEPEDVPDCCKKYGNLL